MTDAQLRKIVDFFIFQPEDESDTGWHRRLQSSGVSPQALADVAAEVMEGMGTPQCLDAAGQLRTGQMNNYIAAKLGYT